MKDVVRVAAAQMDIRSGNLDANLSNISEIAERAVKAGPLDLLVFPALADRGPLVTPSSQKQALKLGESLPGHFTGALGDIATKHGIHIMAGVLEREPNSADVMYSSAALIGPNGQMLGVQRQVHTVGAEKTWFGRGNSIKTFATDLGTVAMIVGTDFQFPEVARVQVLQGAEILCVLLNGTAPGANLPDLIYLLAAGRAWENQCFVVSCNRVGSANGQTFSGRSCIVGMNGQPLSRCEQETEAILVARLDRDRFYEDRADKSYFRDRRPEHYGPIVQPT